MVHILILCSFLFYNGMEKIFTLLSFSRMMSGSRMASINLSCRENLKVLSQYTHMGRKFINLFMILN